MDFKNKDEILKKAQLESKKGYDEFEIAMFSKATSISFVTSLGLSIIVMLLEWIFLNSVNSNCLLIMSGTILTMDFIRYKQARHLKDLIEGCVLSLVFLCALLIFIATLIKRGA